MNGTGHAAIGAATGFIVANVFHTTPSTTLLFVGLGGISGLIPDLDVDGKLRGKITLSHQIIQTVAVVIGVLMVIYSFYTGTGTDRYLGMGIGLGMVVLSSFLKQKHMLILTGIGVLAGGASLQETWIMLFGVYILIASFVSHRSYTHSIAGVVFFGIIAAELEKSLGIHGIFYTCLFSYISHLIADSKLLPFNKRGIKLFLPVSSKEL